MATATFDVNTRSFHSVGSRRVMNHLHATWLVYHHLFRITYDDCLASYTVFSVFKHNIHMVSMSTTVLLFFINLFTSYLAHLF